MDGNIPGHNGKWNGRQETRMIMRVLINNGTFTDLQFSKDLDVCKISKLLYFIKSTYIYTV